ncbi:MAG: AAA family ATPase [Limisphaerales bacterium]
MSESLDPSPAPFWDYMIPREVSFFRLPIYDHFNGGDYHAQCAAGDWDAPKLVERFGPHLRRSDVVRDAKSVGTEAERMRKLLFKLEGDVFVDLDDDQLTVFAPRREVAAGLLADLVKQCLRQPKPEPRFHLLRQQRNDVGVETVKLLRPSVMEDAELVLHYGDDFPDWERRFLQCLKLKSSGIALLRGEPGCGKTSFLRHLIHKLADSHRFYFIPVTEHRLLSSPALTEFWAGQLRGTQRASCVVLLEDAEALLEHRNAENRGSLANLLNISDGLLGEFLPVHLVCTVNCHPGKLDPAIIRPGRMRISREFKRLNPAQAQRLAAAKGVSLPSRADYSLAEIYNPGDEADVAVTERRIGFAA